MQDSPLLNLSAAQLRRAANIHDQITALQHELAGLLTAGEQPQSQPQTVSTVSSGKRTMSPAARAKIAAAAKARWARVRSAQGGSSAAVSLQPKRKISAAGKARIAAAARARWARVRAQQG